MVGPLGRHDRPRDRKEAKAIIDVIRLERGARDISDEFELQKTSAEFREKNRRRDEKLRDVFARYTKTVADQLYTSRFRFIQEIIQNADDAEYSNSSPTLFFRIRPTELVIESNEKGFTRANVDAICDTGESSKKEDANTTGEKGFGFKSVFGIAKQVHIQSGFWSFRFEHTRGQDGLGMVTPIWTEPASLPEAEGINTRFRLQYADPQGGFLSQIIQEFEKLPDTIVFALRKLTEIRIMFEDFESVQGARRPYKQKIFRKHLSPFGSNMTILTKVDGEDGQTRESEIKLRIFQRIVSNLPAKNMLVEERGSGDAANVVIGLQVHPSSGIPVIPDHGQYVFAFLPVQRLARLPFLIHTDFSLTASRQGIPDCERNQELRDSIAALFCDTIVRLTTTDEDPLKLLWMRFLPVSLTEEFWIALWHSIKSRLSESAIYVTENGKLKKYSQVRMIPSVFQHQGQPLFPDTGDDMYLNSAYYQSDIDLIRTNLKVPVLAWTEIAERMELYINNFQQAFFEKYTDRPWFSSFISLIKASRKVAMAWPLIWKLRIVPIQGGGGVSPDSTRTNPVYFPLVINEGSVKIELPDNLQFAKLDKKCDTEPRAHDFFEELGVKRCPDRKILEAILAFRHASEKRGSVQDFVRHLEILFWFSSSLGSFNFSWSFPQLVALDSYRYFRRTSDLYFRSPDPFHADQLLKRTPETDFKGFGFLNHLYLTSPVRSSCRGQTGEMSWQAFLERIGVRHYPDLYVNALNSTTFHEILNLVQRDNSCVFVANLHAHWKDCYSTQSSALTSRLEEAEIPCQNGETLPLKKTILPTKALLEKGANLCVGADLPFIQLPNAIPVDKEDEWRFLRNFGVTCESTVDFYISVLSVLSTYQTPSNMPENTMQETYTRVYEEIAEIATSGDKEKLRGVFSNSSYVFVRTQASTRCDISECVWEGPSFLKESFVLADIYDATPEHIIKEIRAVQRLHRAHSSADPAEILPDFYKSIWDMLTSDDSIANTRSAFNAEALIYVGSRWVKPSACLWNCTIDLPGSYSLQTTYPDLENFFVKTLQVKVMTANVLARELVKASQPEAADRNLIKNLMRNLGEVLSSKRSNVLSEENIDALQKKMLLPVLDKGEARLCKLGERFFINDRESYGRAFSDQICLVDCDFAELTHLHLLFDLLGLKNRYLSNCVEKRTDTTDRVQDEGLTNHLRQRSYALSCCANSYRSPAYFGESTKTHDLLLNAVVFTCADMRTDLIIRMGNTEVTAPSDRTLAVIESDEQNIAVTVPTTEDLYSCYCTELPNMLAGILEVNAGEAVKIIHRILNDDRMTLNDIMKDEDVAHCDWLTKPTLPLERSESTASTVVQEDPIANVRNFEPQIIAHARSEMALERSIPVETYRPIVVAPPSTSALQNVVGQNSYRRFLQFVISQARRVGSSEEGEVLSLASLEDELDRIKADSNLDQYLGPAGTTRDIKIGAAGELYVYERLESLGLPEFTLKNWQSRIRAHVNVLNKYRELRNWSKPEIADLMYSENNPNLETWLREQCKYPFRDFASNEKVSYLLEVKTTPGPCSTPFFMSNNQYQLMKQHQLPDEIEKPVKMVYVLLRVYGLLNGSIGMEVFVDPWRLRGNVLEFSADPWKVVVARNAGI